MCNCRRSGLDEAEFSELHSTVKRGDIVGVVGIPGWDCFDGYNI